MCDQHNFFFEFDKAFTAQLIQKFEASPAHRLSEDVAPPEKGVYALYRRRHIVYAGKALDTTLKRRLAEHARKVSGAEGKLKVVPAFGNSAHAAASRRHSRESGNPVLIQ